MALAKPLSDYLAALPSSDDPEDSFSLVLRLWPKATRAQFQPNFTTESWFLPVWFQHGRRITLPYQARGGMQRGSKAKSRFIP